MARMPDLVKFAQEHDLKICSIAELIRYRLEQEPTIVPVKESSISTPGGDLRTVVFKDTERDETHIAFINGEVDANTPIPVRIHVESDFLAMLKVVNDKPYLPVERAMDYILQEGSGIVVILRYTQSAEEVVYDLEQLQHKNKVAASGHLRLLGAGSQVLASLGAGKIRVIGRERKTHGLSGFGIEIVDYIGLDVY